MWLIQLLLSLLTVISIFQFGFIIDYYLVNRNISSNNIFIFFAIGLGTVGLFQLLISLAGISINRAVVFGLLVCLFLPLFVDHKIRHKLSRVLFTTLKKIKNVPPAFQILAGIFIICILILTFSHIIWGYDAYGFWLSKARAFWVDGKITKKALHLYWPADHPIFWSLVATWFYHLTDQADGYWVRFIPLFVYFMLVGTFAKYTQNKKSRGLMWLLILALTPFLWGNVVFQEYGGNADLIISFYFLLTTVVLIVDNNVIYAALFLSFAVLTKNDALPAMICFMAALPLIAYFLKKRRKHIFTAFLITVGFFIFNFAWKYYYGLNNRYLEQDLTIIFNTRPFIKYLWYTLHAFREEFRQVSRWGIGWWLIIFSLVINFKKIRQNKWVLFGLFLLGSQFISYLWIYYITPENQATHITTSIFRLALQLYPSLLFISMQLSQRVKNN